MKLSAVLAGIVMVVATVLTGTEPGATTGEQTLMRTDLEFARATSTRGLEGWLAFFDSNASIFPGGHPIVTGLEAIRRYYTETGFDPAGLSWTPVGAHLAASGDLGYTYGTWELHRPAATGSPPVAHGQYLTVWKRQSDGTWRVLADIGSTAPAADGSTP